MQRGEWRRHWDLAGSCCFCGSPATQRAKTRTQRFAKRGRRGLPQRDGFFARPPSEKTEEQMSSPLPQRQSVCSIYGIKKKAAGRREEWRAWGKDDWKNIQRWSFCAGVPHVPGVELLVLWRQKVTERLSRMPSWRVRDSRPVLTRSAWTRHRWVSAQLKLQVPGKKNSGKHFCCLGYVPLARHASLKTTLMDLTHSFTAVDLLMIHQEKDHLLGVVLSH